MTPCQTKRNQTFNRSSLKYKYVRRKANFNVKIISVTIN
jgi:hypothetical protein